MQILAKLPHLDNASLTVLQGNAERLLRIGTKIQKTSATAVMPAIEAELATRQEAKASKAKEAAEARRAAAKEKKRKVATEASSSAPAAADACSGRPPRLAASRWESVRDPGKNCGTLANAD